MGDWFVLVHVGLEPSITEYNITDSIVSFDLRLGLQYAPDYLDVVFQTPIVDTLGNTYVWGSTLDYNTQIRIISPNARTYFVGYITSYEVDGEVAKARLMQSYYFQGKYGFTGSFSSSTQSDISNALEAATGIDMQDYVGYAPYWASNPITGVSYKNMPIPQILQRLHEITDSTNHYLQVNWIGPYAGRDESVLMTGTYGGADATSVPMTLDNVLLSAPEWKDNRDRVINSVTVKYTGGEVTSSDATSISNYRESSTTIYRPEYNNSTDAVAVADSILYQLKDPKESCRVKLDFGIFDAWDTNKIGCNLYRITDGVSGKSVDLPMREAIIHYPSLIADCTFDQLGLNTDEYVINTENRINVLEANQPNQPLDTTSSPTFANVTSYGMSILNFAASANTRNSHDAEKLFTWGSAYAKQKTITLTSGLGIGTYRVSFDLGNQGSNATTTSYGRVYKNGVAIGTARTRTGLTYVTYTEDFSGPLNAGDTLELWAYQNGGSGDGGKCRNFRIMYDVSLPTAVPSSNS